MNPNTNVNPMDTTDSGTGMRRSFMPQKYNLEGKKTKKNLRPTFSPYARMVEVDSHKDLDEDVKRAIWWQEEDYEGFRKTARIIARAMLQGGSEIWLQGQQDSHDNGPSARTTGDLHLSNSLADRKVTAETGNSKAKQDHKDARDKWWHRFGHSRRGLEHIASIGEGRKRQVNVRKSIRSVLEEQGRQKMKEVTDPMMIRLAYSDATKWARELAVAAAASDADAVRMNFDDHHRKTREFYLRREYGESKRRQQEEEVEKLGSSSRPSLKAISTSILDANTTSQIQYRRLALGKKKADTSPKEVREAYSEKESEPSDLELPSSMAKKAAGFCAGKETKETNMSAVLAGMGPLPRQIALEAAEAATRV